MTKPNEKDLEKAREIVERIRNETFDCGSEISLKDEPILINIIAAALREESERGARRIEVSESEIMELANEADCYALDRRIGFKAGFQAALERIGAK